MLIVPLRGPAIDLSDLAPGLDPRWERAVAAIDGFVRCGELAKLEALWPRLAENDDWLLLARLAFRGRVHAGPDGARAFLRSLADPPAIETTWSTPELSGALLGHATRQRGLVPLLDEVTAANAYVFGIAIQEHLLRDGELTEPALASWTSPIALARRAHPWERELIVRSRSPRDVLGNFHVRRSDEPRWPEGMPCDAPPPSLVARRQWGLDEHGDPSGPHERSPPVGPFVDAELYPNAHSWCIETEVTDDDPFALGRWPFPDEHLALHEVRAEEVTARQLLREWLWRGLVGGAYGKRRCAARARRLAWTSLAELAGVEADLATVDGLTEIASAAASLRVGGFRSRGPSVDPLGGDFGFVAVRPDGQAVAAAHTDSD